jgi:hypothetical protein
MHFFAADAVAWTQQVLEFFHRCNRTLAQYITRFITTPSRPFNQRRLSMQSSLIPQISALGDRCTRQISTRWVAYTAFM